MAAATAKADAAPAAASPEGGVVLSAGQRKQFDASKAQKESIGVKMTPSEIAVLETKILKMYPGLQ